MGKLGQQLKIKQNQTLIMTPQLQQAIKLLQLTNIELTDFIDKAQLENPFLKEDCSLDLENTFDTHISSNSKKENQKLYNNEIVKSGTNISAGEVIEKTLKYKISLREFLINQININ